MSLLWQDWRDLVSKCFFKSQLQICGMTNIKLLESLICSLGLHNSNKCETLRLSCTSTEWRLFYMDSLASRLRAQLILLPFSALVWQNDEHPGKCYQRRISCIVTGLAIEWEWISHKKFWNCSEYQMLLLFSSQWHTFLNLENTIIILVIYCWVFLKKKKMDC